MIPKTPFAIPWLSSTRRNIASLSASMVLAVILCVSGSTVAGASSAPSPVLAKFLPANYRVTSVTKVYLDDSHTPQEAVTAVGPINSSGFATSLVLLLAWDSYAKRWTSVYDTLSQPSWQTSSQFGKGPGLINLTDAGPQVRVIRDQSHGRGDLLYWLNSIEGNTGFLIVGVIHFQDQIATRVYSFGQSYGHVFSMDKPSHATVGAAVIGSKPRQQVEVTLPWLTADDSESQAARMYYFTIAPRPKSFDEYEVVYNDQPYVGVELSGDATVRPSTVEHVNPNSPAAGKLHVGDVIEGVVGSALPGKDTEYLLGPEVIEEVALDRPGKTIGLDVLRNGRMVIVKLKLAQWPDGQTPSAVVAASGTDLSI